MDDDLTHYMKATSRLRDENKQLEENIHVVLADLGQARTEIERLRAAVEGAIRLIEQEQFRGNGNDQLSELYRILCDESIAREPEAT
jgi:predicted  nucleic acid-binding Zn-ribbon protein